MGIIEKKQKSNKKRKLSASRKRGFSIGEVLIASAVLTIGMLSLLFLMVNGMRHSIDSRDQIVATALAQEGLELVRNFRDNNAASGAANYFSTGFPGNTDLTCRIDYNQNSLSCPNSGNGYVLNFSGNYYNYDTNSPTKFRRKIEVRYFLSDGVTLTNATNAVSATITSIVAWGVNDFPATCNLANRCVSTQDILTNNQ